MSDRYEGQPLLRLMELYVLSIIGKTSSDDTATLEKMTPKLQQLFGTQGSWQEAVAKASGLPASFSDDVHRKWNENCSMDGMSQPQQFAEMIVDQYLSS